MVLKITPRIPNEVRPSSDFAKFSQKLAVKKRKHMNDDDDDDEWTPIGTFKLLRIFANFCHYAST